MLTTVAGNGWPGVIEAYREWLPVKPDDRVVTLREGGTALLPAHVLVRGLEPRAHRRKIGHVFLVGVSRLRIMRWPPGIRPAPLWGGLSFGTSTVASKAGD